MPESFLVIDDSKLLHQMYRLIFSQGDLAGSTVHYAANGREGYALLAQHLHPHVPVALVTTEGSEEDEARGRAVGAWDYLRKPFQPSDIQALVRRARELRRSRGAA